MDSLSVGDCLLILAEQIVHANAKGECFDTRWFGCQCFVQVRFGLIRLMVGHVQMGKTYQRRDKILINLQGLQQGIALGLAFFETRVGDREVVVSRGILRINRDSFVEMLGCLILVVALHFARTTGQLLRSFLRNI